MTYPENGAESAGGEPFYGVSGAPSGMENPVEVFVEAGKKKVFAGALAWPGWCRSGRDEQAALHTLLDYGHRYAKVLQHNEIAFRVPQDVSALVVVERHVGNATTDFGAPAMPLQADTEPMDPMALEEVQALLQACWKALDKAVQRAAGREMRKGPLGGGRDLERIVDHVLEADQVYLARLGWKHKRGEQTSHLEGLSGTRQAVLEALEMAVQGDLPQQGPRGGVRRPARFFVRQVAWHVLDHTWEIEDRVV